MYKAKLVLIFVLVLFSVSLAANGGLFGWKGVHGSLGRITLASQSIDLSGLNDEISFNFESTYPETFLKYGAQYLYISNDVALGMEGYLMSNGNHNDEIYKYQVSANAVFFDLGYVLYSNYYTVITPWIGIGLGSITYSMVSQDHTWIQAVDQGIPYVFSSSKHNLLMNFGFSWDAVYRNAAIGLNVSYMLPLDSTEWEIAGEVMEDGPKSSLQGLHLGICLGFADIDMW